MWLLLAVTHLKPEESSAAEHWDTLKVFYNLSVYCARWSSTSELANFLLSLEKHSNCLASEALCHTWQCPSILNFSLPFLCSSSSVDYVKWLRLSSTLLLCLSSVILFCGDKDRLAFSDVIVVGYSWLTYFGWQFDWLWHEDFHVL